MSKVGVRVRPFKISLVVAVLVVAALSLSMVLIGGKAMADPALQVTKNGGKVLLGGDASVQITVRNTGLDRGFNLSLTDVFTSIPLRGDGKNKTVQFVSASSSDGPLTPTSVTTDPTTNSLTVNIDDIRDLMPTESTTITIVVRPSDPSAWPWQVGDKIHDAVTAKVNTRADGGGAWITGNATADTDVIPIKLLTKTANQSTADRQATGCGELPQGGWPYSYTLDVQNNYTTQTDNVVVTDTIPDGIEYLGPISNPPSTVARNNATGQWTLTWNIGTMAPSANFTTTYRTGIRYDYFGTDHGGTNRPYNDYSWPSGFGTLIPDGTGLTNTAGLTATFQGTPVTDSDDAGVTAAYATIHKGVSPGTAGSGSTVHFSLTRYASEYYNTSNHVVRDVLPDGLTYTPGSALIAPNIIEQNTPGPGQTRLTWNTLGALTAGQGQTITFDATVDYTWSVDPSPERNWVVAGDSVRNTVDMSCDWADVVQPPRSGTISDASSAAVVAVGPKPPVTKEVAPDNGGTPGTYGSSINATVGDVLWFRVRVNTSDGTNPTVHNVRFGNLDVVDWLPQGTQMTGAAVLDYSNKQPDETSPDFHYSPPPVKYTSKYNQQPQAILSGPLTGEAWSLGNVSENGWWEVEFKVVVQNDTGIVTTGKTYNDYGKTSWENSKLQQYSDRAIAAVNYGEPHLTAAKAVTSPPAHPGAGQTYGYTITLTNDGTAAAHNVQVTDTLPVGMRGYDPRGSTVTVKRGTTTLAAGTDYTLNYTLASGQFVISFDNGTIDTPIPPPPATDNYITIEYSSKVDSNIGAGASLTDNASTTYSAQKSNITPNRSYGPVTASATVTLPSIAVAKSIVGTNTVPIGTGAGSVVTYRMLVTVPARNIAPSGVQLVDVINQDSLEYVSGAVPRNTLLTPIISGAPDVAAQFSTPGHPTDADPTTISWHTPNPGTTLNWSMSPIDNHGSDTDYVFQVDYKLLASGLTRPVSQGGTDVPSNWKFWPNTAPPGPTGDNTVPDTGTFKWNDGIGNQSVSNGPVTTHVQQPYLEMTKTNNKPGTVRGGEVVTYTVTVRNTGTSTSYDNTVVDQLPSGMLGAVPSVTSVTLNTTPLANPANYHYTYDGSGKQTFNLDGDTATNMAPGDLLTIVYTATVEGNVGSGATLTNNSYCEYYSQSGSGGRHVQNGSDSANKNRASSSVHTAQATVAKSIVSGDPAIIGDTVTYDLTVTVPEGTNLYPLDANGWTVTDKINQDGLEYDSGSATPIYVSGTPVTAAAFHTGYPPPTQTYYPPTHGDTLVWHLDKVENPTPGAGNYVFSVRFTCKVTGLITQVSRGGSATNQSNWNWWWTTGGNPTVNNTATDYGRIDWSDGLISETASTPGNPNSITTNVHQPALDLTKSNLAPGGVSGGATIQYTTNVTNNGTSTSYKNKVVDTLPVGMRQATPTVTQVTLAGVTLTENTDYWLNNPPYNPATGVLTIDLDHGVSQTNILTGAANKLVVKYQTTVDADVGAGRVLTNIASVAYGSKSDGSGRNIPTNLDVAQHNTKSSTVTVPGATIAKTQDTVGNKSAIGQPFHYNIDLTIPAHSSTYDTTATDTVPDGLNVDSYSTYLDGVSQSIGSVALTPQGNGSTKVDWTAIETVAGRWQNGTGSNQVLRLRLTVHIRNAFNGGTLVKGTPPPPPPPQSTFSNSATMHWNESPGANPHSPTSSAPVVTATEPYLNLGIVNHAGGPVPGDTTVGYTVTATNAGTSTSYRNLVEITMPPGMRNTTPVITDIRIGAYHFAPSDYTTTYVGGLFTINMLPGAPNTDIPLSGAVIVDFNGKTDVGVGSGASLAVLASIGYNSWSDGSGRQTNTTTNTADHNTKDTTISTVLATMAKSQNAPSNKATIGSAYDYTVTVTVPQKESLFNSGCVDIVPDGLTVTGTSPSTGSVGLGENLNGTTTVTWTIGDYTNVQSGPADITLTISVQVDKQYSDGSDVERGNTFGNTVSLGWYDDHSTDPAHHHQAQASATDVTICEPDLAITKVADNTTPVAGDSILYTIQVTNNGDWPAYNVTVNDSVESGLTYTTGSITGAGANQSLAPALSWDIQAGQGAIAPAQVLTLTYRATVDGGATMGQVIHDTAAITYDGGQPAPYGRPYGPLFASRDITIKAPVLTVVKEVTSNPNPDWGETVGYKVTVANTGNAPASNLNVSDTIPSPYFHYVNGSTNATWPGHSYILDPAGTPGPALNWNALNATLQPTEQLVLTFNMGVDQWAAYGLRGNSATSHATDPAGTALPDVTGSVNIDVQQQPGVSVVKTFTSPPVPFVPVGDNATYTMRVTNTGNTNLTVIQLTDTYDSAYWEYVSALPTPTDTTTPGSITWDNLVPVTPLAPQAFVDVTITLKALQSGHTTNTDDTATVSATDDQGHTNIPATDTNTAVTITSPNLQITKTLNHPDAYVPVGGAVSYTIHVANTGDTAAVAPVQLTDTYNATYLRFNGAAPPATTYVPGTVTWADASGGAGIAASGSIDVTVNFVTLAPGRTPNTNDTSSVVAVDEHGAPLSDTVTNSDLVITNPKITVTKQLAPGQEPYIKVGENVTYRITVTNTGDTKVVAPVTLTDQYDGAYLSFQSASTNPTSDSGGLLKWADLTGGNGLTPGASVVVDVVFKTLQEGTAPGTTDIATVAGCKDQHDDPIATASADAYVNVGPNKVLGATDWFLAEGSTGGGFDTWILLQNPGKVQANVAVTFATAEGPRPPLNVVVPEQSRYTIRIQDYVPNDFHVSTIVKSDMPICAERSMYWDKRFYGVTNRPGTPQPYEMKAGHANMGTPMDSVALAKARKTNAEVNPGERLYFPEGSTKQGFDTWILVCNPGNVGAFVQVHLMTPNGEVNGGSFGVPQQSRYTLHVNDLLPNTDQVAVELDSNQPVVAERSMYWDPNASQLQPYQMKGGTSSPGSDDPANDLYIAEGSTAVGFETYVLVQNPQTEAARITADFMTAAGVAATDTFDMGPNTRATIKVSDFVNGDFHVSTRIHADHPVVAERSMYWDKRKTSNVVQMTEGHSAAGVTSTGGLWTVPEGSTGGGFDSWVLISNPTDKDTTADVTFMTAQGPTQPMTISLPASTRYTLHVNDFVPNDFHVSTQVQTKGQIVVERAMYWDRRQSPGIQPYEMMGGHSTTGVDP